MQRGLLFLQKEEVADIINHLPMEKYYNTPFSNKLYAANNVSSTRETEIDIELSEEELEIILDEMGIPNIELDTEYTKTSRKKISALFLEFRKERY